jgi:hypothetical protein
MIKENKMKKIGVSISIAILFTMIVTSVGIAALPGSGWWTFYQIQNISGSTGSFSMTAYDSDSSTTYASDTFTFDDGSALAFNPGLDPNYPTGDRIGFTTDLPDGFEGSVAISSQVEVVAIAQLGNNTVGTVGAGGTATSFYQGVGGSLTDTQINFPTVKHNFSGQTTTFAVQAAGQDADVTLTYTMNDGNTYDQTKSISANSMYLFDPANAGVPAGSTADAAVNPSLGSAIAVSTTGNIAAVVAEHPHTGSPAPYVLSTRGLFSSDADSTIIAPTIKNSFYGGTTGFSVQNIGSNDALVEIELTVTNATNPSLIGNTYTDQEVIKSGESTVFSSYRNNLGGLPSGTFAAAVVTSVDDATYDPQNLVGTVNETNNFGKATYSAFPKTTAETVVGLPMVKEMFFGGTTGVAVVNVGDAATKIYAEYVDQNGVKRTFETVNTIQPGAAVSFYKVYLNTGNQFTGLPDFSVLNGTKNSVIFTSDGTQPIVALAQESDQDSSDGLLDVKNYEGFSIP